MEYEVLLRLTAFVLQVITANSIILLRLCECPFRTLQWSASASSVKKRQMNKSRLSCYAFDAPIYREGSVKATIETQGATLCWTSKSKKSLTVIDHKNPMMILHWFSALAAGIDVLCQAAVAKDHTKLDAVPHTTKDNHWFQLTSVVLAWAKSEVTQGQVFLG